MIMMMMMMMMMMIMMMVVDRSAGGPGLRGVSPGQAEQDAVLVELLHSLHTRSE